MTDLDFKHNLTMTESSMIEELLEYQLLARLGQVMWQRNLPMDVFRSSTDRRGFDLLIHANGFSRQVQLKGMKSNATTQKFKLKKSLEKEPSACFVLMVYDLSSLDIGHLKWLGGEPGATMPDLGDRVAKHNKANAQGVKAERSALRDVSIRKLSRIATFEELAGKLFGVEV